MDPEDAKSLDSNEGVVALAEERSENNSSNSDIVHVEREEAELLAEGDGEELQESMMSVLGTESELAALRAEMKEEEDGAGAAADAATAGPALSHTALIPDAPQPLLVLEEPVLLEAPDSLGAVPSLPESAVLEATLEPVPESPASAPASASAPDPAPAPELQAEVPRVVLSAAPVVESPPPPSPVKEPPVPPVPAPVPTPEPVAEPAPEPVLEPAVVPEPVPIQEAQLEVPPEVSETKAVEVAAAPVLEAQVPPPVEAPVQAQAVEPDAAPASEPAVEPQPEPEPEPEPEPKPESSELPVLLYGGAALVVMAAVAAYGVLAYRKK